MTLAGATYANCLSPIKVDNRSEREHEMNPHRKCESLWVEKKREKEKKRRRGAVMFTRKKVYCEDGQVLFMDVSLH